ncbi:MAG: hypothetical protein P8130_12470 [Deltaproteobacteria bacterium]
MIEKVSRGLYLAAGDLIDQVLLEIKNQKNPQKTEQQEAKTKGDHDS